MYIQIDKMYSEMDQKGKIQFILIFLISIGILCQFPIHLKTIYYTTEKIYHKDILIWESDQELYHRINKSHDSKSNDFISNDSISNETIPHKTSLKEELYHYVNSSGRVLKPYSLISALFIRDFKIVRIGRFGRFICQQTKKICKIL